MKFLFLFIYFHLTWCHWFFKQDLFININIFVPYTWSPTLSLCCAGIYSANPRILRYGKIIWMIRKHCCSRNCCTIVGRFPRFFSLFQLIRYFWKMFVYSSLYFEYLKKISNLENERRQIVEEDLCGEL